MVGVMLYILFIIKITAFEQTGYKYLLRTPKETKIAKQMIDLHLLSLLQNSSISVNSKLLFIRESDSFSITHESFQKGGLYKDWNFLF